jgi:hypothetical protein
MVVVLLHTLTREDLEKYRNLASLLEAVQSAACETDIATAAQVFDNYWAYVEQLLQDYNVTDAEDSARCKISPITGHVYLDE